MHRFLGRSLGWATSIASFSSLISSSSALAAIEQGSEAPTAQAERAPVVPDASPTPSAEAAASQPSEPAALATAAPAAAKPASAPSPQPGGSGRVDVGRGVERGNVNARDSYDGPPLLLGGGRKIKVGGYAALGGAYTRFIGRDSGLVSLEGALLLDHRLSLGLIGYGFTRTPDGPDANDGHARQFGAGYGGAALRYSLLCDAPVYFSFGVVLGAGAVNLHRDNGWDDEDDWGDGWGHDDEDWDAGELDAFLVAQPEIAIHANLTRWLRIGGTFGYRFTGGVRRFGLEEGDLNGIVAGGTIAFGWF